VRGLEQLAMDSNGSFRVTEDYTGGKPALAATG